MKTDEVKEEMASYTESFNESDGYSEQNTPPPLTERFAISKMSLTADRERFS
jgi:hypothetical protein